MSKGSLQKRLLTVASVFVANTGGIGASQYGLKTYLVFRWTDETAEPAKISFEDPKTEIERKIIDEILNGSWPVMETNKFAGRFFFCSEVYVTDAGGGEKNWKIIGELTYQQIIELAESVLVLEVSLDDKLSKR